MSYSFNGNDLESCRALCENFYNSMFDDSGHVNTFNSNSSGELTGEYLGATKDDFYYYRGYAIQENDSQAVNDFTTYGSDYRTPFHVNDNNVRPFFALQHNTETQTWLLTFYVGCIAKSSNPDWNFNNKRYGDANRNYDVALFSSTKYPLRSSYLNVTTNGESSTAVINTQQFNKEHTYGNYVSSAYPNIRDISVFGIHNYIYPWYYGKDLDAGRIKAVKFDTNIPCFDADDSASIEKWVNDYGYNMNIIGAILVNVWLLMDCTDGNIARSVKKEAFGPFADSMSSYLLVGLLCTCIGFAAYFEGGLLFDKNNVWKGDKNNSETNLCLNIPSCIGNDNFIKNNISVTLNGKEINNFTISKSRLTITEEIERNRGKIWSEDS